MKTKTILLCTGLMVGVFGSYGIGLSGGGMGGGGGGGGGGMGGGGGGMAGPNGVAHQTHLTVEWGPQLGDQCSTCHDGMPSPQTVNYNHCIPCHSPDGMIDGMNDPVVGARYNFNQTTSLIYDDNGAIRPGKEKWCAGCHDDGSSVIHGVRAPNIAGKSISGNWQRPATVIESDIQGAENLLDGNLETGNIDSYGTYVLFDLGAKTDISHIRLYSALGATSYLEVYGGNDPDNLMRILFGQSVLFAAPSWKVGPEDGWIQNRLDNFSPIRYIKLVRVGVGPFSVNSLREFEFKKDLEYGFYVNGHKIGCDNCHNTRESHTDGIARTYAFDQNNYNSGYRLINVQVDWQVVPAMEIPRVGCNSEEDPATTNDFALCFSCHDRTKILGDSYATGIMFQDPLQTNYRNDTHVDVNGIVNNEHLRHIRGRDYCGNSPDWDSDWDGIEDSPISCVACHNVHGSPTPTMTRHGELTSTSGTTDKVPMINFRYLDSNGQSAPDMTDVMQSTGGMTQFYAPGPGTPDKNSTCRMCHNDMISYQRTPVQVNHGLLEP